MKNEELKKFKKSIKLLNQAWMVLNDLAHTLAWDEGKSDILKYREEIGELLNCDNGEAGMEVHYNNLKEKK